MSGHRFLFDKANAPFLLPPGKTHHNGSERLMTWQGDGMRARRAKPAMLEPCSGSEMEKPPLSEWPHSVTVIAVPGCTVPGD